MPENNMPPSQLQQPPLLKPGDRVALFSPSSHLGQNASGQLEEARNILVNWGLKVEPIPLKESRHLYLAGTDEQRATQFQELYGNPEIKGLFMTRGGYGTGRMVGLLDQQAIRESTPKPIVGFSDATALFTYLQNTAGITLVHGPGLAAPSLLSSPTRSDDLEALRRLLFEPDFKPVFPVKPLFTENSGVNHPKGGKAEGALVGGCLSVLVTTLGTRWEVKTKGTILFLEDIDEEPYRIDRMLNHLNNAGKFEGLRGLVFGHLKNCDSEPPGLLNEMLLDFFAGALFPIATGMQAGHDSPNRAFPLGRQSRLILPEKGEGERAGRLEFD